MNKIKLNSKKLEKMVKNTRKNGGYSDDILTQKRYIVSMELDKEVIIPINNFNQKTLKNAIKNFTLKVSQGVGTWLNDNKVYIDINQGFDKLEEAMSIARENNQLAIFDTLEEVAIPTGIVR